MIRATADNSANWIARFRDKVLLYAGNHQEMEAFQLHELVAGAVLHGRQGATLARRLRNHGYRGILMWDPENYGISLSQQAPQLLPDDEERAVTNQRALGVDAFLAPTMMPARDDPDAIKKLLDLGQRFVTAAELVDKRIPSFVTLPLSGLWLGSQSGHLVKDVADAGLPVALVLAATGDPLQRAAAIRTVLSVIEAAPLAIGLRCDLSAIGAVACGALAGAIGASSTYRHLYLPRKGSSQTIDRDGHVLVPGLSTWLKRATLGRLDKNLEALRCHAPICGGRSVYRFLGSDPSTRREAEVHAVEWWAELARQVLAPDNREQRVDRWQQHCLNSLSAFEEEGVTGLAARPGFLVGWSAWEL
jgi:hypothetical protein